MRHAFIIMQIGNPELDRVCRDAIVPALVACGLDPKRVDKHNQGGLLKSEILRFIEQSEIIIADLTNERPNCYLEIGYAMGIEKFRNLILTVREDHSPGSEHYSPVGPKIHFDVAGYDILFWTRENLDAFRTQLEKKVLQRLEGAEPISDLAYSRGQKVSLGAIYNCSYSDEIAPETGRTYTTKVIMRNVNADDSLTIVSAVFFSPKGIRVKEFVTSPIVIGPRSSLTLDANRETLHIAPYHINDERPSFEITWQSKSRVIPPVITGVLLLDGKRKGNTDAKVTKEL